MSPASNQVELTTLIKDFLSCRKQRVVLNGQHMHCTQKTYFLSPNVLKKMVFSKKSYWNMIFSVSSGKIVFLFPENIILFFIWKIKDDLSQKNIWKYNIFFKCSEKMVFPIKSHWKMIFLVLSGKMAFLFPESIIFLLQTENEG